VAKLPRPSERFVYLTIYIAARDADVVQSRIAQALKLASLACPPLPIRDAQSVGRPLKRKTHNSNSDWKIWQMFGTGSRSNGGWE
jgi:hypothetical protein